MTAAAATVALAARIAGLRRSVADLDRAVAFYRGALGFEIAGGEAHRARSVRLELGSEWIELVAVDAGAVPPPAFAPDTRFQHAAIVVRDMAAAWCRLMAFDPVTITVDGPQRLPASAGGVTAFKFRDPDGHPLELIALPSGTGDSRWQRPSDALTLGIDHFALVVADADVSIGFYAGLGFELTARQTNRGEEQARLDGLAAPVVDVIALAIPAMPTPHLELLCYRHPLRHGVPKPAAPIARDVVAMCSLPGQDFGAGLADPDGHAMSMSSSSRAASVA